MRIATLVVLLVVGACGGGGGGPATQQASLLPIAAIDGHTRSDGGFASAVLASRVGDDDFVSNGLAYRSFFSFDLSAVPPGATIVSAVLTVNRSGTSGDPFTGHGDLVVDHVDTGGTLDAGDHLGGTLAADVVRFAASVVLPSVAVTGSVQDDVTAGRARTEFRVRFETESDTDDTFDYLLYDNTEQGGAFVPSLEVTFIAP